MTLATLTNLFWRQMCGLGIYCRTVLHSFSIISILKKWLFQFCNESFKNYNFDNLFSVSSILKTLVIRKEQNTVLEYISNSSIWHQNNWFSITIVIANIFQKLEFKLNLIAYVISHIFWILYVSKNNCHCCTPLFQDIHSFNGVSM